MAAEAQRMARMTCRPYVGNSLAEMLLYDCGIPEHKKHCPNSMELSPELRKEKNLPRWVSIEKD